MITKAEVMPVVLVACPSFTEVWEALQREWADEPAPLYIALGEFAGHLVALLESGDDDGLEAAFEAIERLHIDGEHDVREAASVGILEDLQNCNLHRSTKLRDFERFLRPESRHWWDKLNRFWNGDAGALTDSDGAT